MQKNALRNYAPPSTIELPTYNGYSRTWTRPSLTEARSRAKAARRRRRQALVILAALALAAAATLKGATTC